MALTRGIARAEDRSGPSPWGESSPLTWTLRVLVVVIVAAVAATAWWRYDGGSLYVVQTPSMCPTACVGSLVVDRPLGTTPVRPGMIVTINPPGDPSTYTHRVVRVNANGTFRTRGDNAFNIDPWVLTRADVRGREVAMVWGLGWLSLALPFLGLGMLIVLVLRRYVPRRWRPEWDDLFATLLVLLPVWRLHPLVRGVLVYSTHPGRAGLVVADVVNTGLLPAQFHPVGGHVASFVASGHHVWIRGHVRHGDFLRVGELASFHWWGWVIVWLVVASPLLGHLWRLARHPELVAELSNGLHLPHGSTPPPATERTQPSSAEPTTSPPPEPSAAEQVSPTEF